jgi:hypothetical protein
METKKSKVIRDISTMTVTIAGVSYPLTVTEPKVLSELALAGFADNLIDCVASMTLKAGFTTDERLAKRQEKADEINAGILRSIRVQVVNVEKAIEKISGVAEKSDKLTDRDKAKLAELLAKMKG